MASFRNRLFFTPFWRLTAYGCLFRKEDSLVGFGGDEFHNRSVYVVIPLVGSVVLFYERRQNTGPEHLYGRINGELEGFVDGDCAVCAETLGWMMMDDVHQTFS